jgi:hypothetical protein
MQSNILAVELRAAERIAKNINVNKQVLLNIYNNLQGLFAIFNVGLPGRWTLEKFFQFI